MRTLTFILCGFHGSVALPDKFFDEYGKPRWNLLNSHFSSVPLRWEIPIGGVQVDEPVNYTPPSVDEELKQLRDAVEALEKKLR